VDSRHCHTAINIRHYIWFTASIFICFIGIDERCDIGLHVCVCVCVCVCVTSWYIILSQLITASGLAVGRYQATVCGRECCRAVTARWWRVHAVNGERHTGAVSQLYCVTYWSADIYLLARLSTLHTRQCMHGQSVSQSVSHRLQSSWSRSLSSDRLTRRLVDLIVVFVRVEWTNTIFLTNCNATTCGLPDRLLPCAAATHASIHLSYKSPPAVFHCVGPSVS